MPINSKHPAYLAVADDWLTMRDALEGLRAIRSNITRYLPVPPGLVAGVQPNLNTILASGNLENQNRYTFYASFAEYPEIVADTLNGIQGIVHEKPPTVDLPADMKYLEERATPAGDTLYELWERVTREVFSTGRYELLGDIVEDELYLCTYAAESLINWRAAPKLLGGGTLLAVLEEQTREEKRDDHYEHEDVTRYRELRIDPESGAYQVRVWVERDGKAPEIERTEDDGADADGWLTPVLFGRAFAEVPLTIINAVDRGFAIGPIPLLSAARRAVSIFRKSADYNRALYQKGDPQPYIFGVDPEEVPSMIGGGTIWGFKHHEGTAGYLDIDGQGIPLMREAIQDQYERFAAEYGRLMNAGDKASNESGEALKRKAASGQVTAKGVLVNAAAGVQQALRTLARLKGKSEAEANKIFFAPNLDFAEPMMTGRELLEYVLAKNAGATLSARTIHEIARRHKVTDMSYEEELAAVSEEVPTVDRDGEDEDETEGAKKEDSAA